MIRKKHGHATHTVQNNITIALQARVFTRVTRLNIEGKTKLLTCNHLLNSLLLTCYIQFNIAKLDIKVRLGLEHCLL